MTEFFSYVWSLLILVKDTISDIITFIGNVGTFLLSYINILPTDISIVISFGLIIITALLLYRFLR